MKSNFTKTFLRKITVCNPGLQLSNKLKLKYFKEKNLISHNPTFQ